MPALRAVLIASMIVFLAALPLAFPREMGGASNLVTAYAAHAAGLSSGDKVQQRHPEKDADQKNRNDNQGDNNNNGNGNGNDNGNGNGNDNGNDVDDGDDNSNDNDFPNRPVTGPASSGAGSAAAQRCSTPGQEMVFTSNDGRVSVRVFSNMGSSVRISIRGPVDPASVPAVPGRLADQLIYEVIAENCGGGNLSSLPNEANLGVHYSDGDVAGLTESSLKIAYLTNQGTPNAAWRDVDKQANDPPANYVSATITSLGYYSVHQP
jgi:hypothetical protein